MGDRPSTHRYASFLLAWSCLAFLGVACSSGASGGAATSGAAATAASPAPAAPVAPSATADPPFAVAPPPEAEQSEPDGWDPPAGYLVWAIGLEPLHLHVDELPVTVAAYIRQGLVEGLYGIDSSIGYYPELLAAEAEVSKDDRNRVRIAYRLREGLRWSDGEPLTAADVAYTHKIMVEGCRLDADGSIVDGSIVDGDDTGCVYGSADRTGYDRVTDFEVHSNTEFTVSMSGFYPGWRSLYSQVLAAHAYGETAAEVTDRLRSFVGPDGPLPSSGPLVMDRWDRGEQLLLVANPRYHGSVSPDRVTELVTEAGGVPPAGVLVAFTGSDRAATLAVADGRADLAVVPTKAYLGDLIGDERVAITGRPGPDFEHLGMNLLNPHLGQAPVRRALAAAVDKAAIVEKVYRPLVGDSLPAGGVGNSYWMPNQAYYEDHQGDVGRGAVAEARELLESAGYEVGSDGIYRHEVHGRLSLRLTTTEGDELRRETQDVIVDQLAAAGVEIVIDNLGAGRFFRSGPFAEQALAASASRGARGDGGLWDLALFGWSPGAWPGGQSGAYRSGSEFNPYGFASPTFDATANECDATVDDAERAACYNSLDRLVTTIDGVSGDGADDGATDEGLFVVPLTQRPLVVVANAESLPGVAAVVPFDAGGPLVNVGDYRLSGQ